MGDCMLCSADILRHRKRGDSLGVVSVSGAFVLSVYEEKQHSIEDKKNREIKKTLKVKNTKVEELENNER